MLQQISIKDLYAGKPDAKDEINTGGLDEFVNSFILPNSFDIDKLIKDNFYFITGYKGTGKTALLFYLDNYTKKLDESACSSFIFFKEEFTDTKKQELEELSKRLLSSITIGDDILTDGSDFEFIWRWILFKKIIDDNKEYNNGLFANNDAWNTFEKTMSKIVSATDKKRFAFPPKIKLSVPLTDPATNVSITTELEVDFQNNAKTQDAYKQFIKIIEAAEDSLKKVQRTDIPY
jgi:hypothetical protein